CYGDHPAVTAIVCVIRISIATRPTSGALRWRTEVAGRGGFPATFMTTSIGLPNRAEGPIVCVAELANDSALRSKIIKLAFHVVYWNHFGWCDLFS
ncbi:MAG: hypothetical protein ACXW2Q_07500, partial [Thermoanaerobaculia bacterium]